MTTLPKDIDNVMETKKPRLRIERDSGLKQESRLGRFKGEASGASASMLRILSSTRETIPLGTSLCPFPQETLLFPTIDASEARPLRTECDPTWNRDDGGHSATMCIGRDADGHAFGTRDRDE